MSRTGFLGRVLAIATFALCARVLAPALAAEEKTVLSYSIKEARASLWQIHYPQSTFVTEKYSPCVAEDDENYGCDRTRYNQDAEHLPPRRCAREDQGSARDAQAGGRRRRLTDDGGVGTASEWPRGNPVTVVHGLASGHWLRRPSRAASLRCTTSTTAAAVRPRRTSRATRSSVTATSYEERCAVVDAFSETGMYPAPSTRTCSPARTTAVHLLHVVVHEPRGATPPGGSKEAVVDRQAVGGRRTYPRRAHLDGARREPRATARSSSTPCVR